MTESLKDKYIREIWQKARKHGQASRVGMPADMESFHICECCDQPIKKDEIPLSENSKEFQIFGFGYPLYFSYLKYCILLVVILVASRTGTSLYMATKENYDFCYGSGQVPARLSGHGGSPHHFMDSAFENANYVGLRHFGHDLLTTNKEHEIEHKSHNNHFLQNHAKNQTLTQNPTGNHQEGAHSNHPTSDHEGPTDHEDHGDHGDHGEHHLECTSFMVYLSIFVGEEEFSNYFLRILGFLLHIVALIGIRNMLVKEEQYYDERTCSLSDYSVIVSNLPQCYGSGKMVRDLFKAEFKKNSEVKEIIYVFENEQIKKIEKKIETLQKQKLKAIQNDDESKLRNLQTEILSMESELDRQIHSVKGDIQRDYIECDKIIVILNTEKDKADVVKLYQQKTQNGTTFAQYFNHHSEKTSGSTQIKIKQAPEPNEIVWEHIDQSDIKRRFLIFRGWLLTFLFLAVVTAVFYLIMRAKTNLFVDALELSHQNPHDPQIQSKKTFATIIVFLALFGVVLFNKFIMSKVLHYFVHMERHAYTDEEGHSFAIKYSVGMFFTTALMTLAVEAFTFKNFYSHPYGVIEEETIMFFVTAFFIPLVWTIHPYNLAKKISLKMKENTLVTQKEANELVEDFPYDLGKRYAEIFEIMWFTFLYSELIPLGSFLILIGLGLYYWVDKYNFLRRSALKEGLSGKITIMSLKSMDATLFLAPAGRVVFSFIIHHEIDYLGLVLTAIGLVYLFLPMTKFIQHLNEQKFKLEEKTYDQAKRSFKEHYFTDHPVYKLTHKKDIEKFRVKVAEYYRKEMENAKIYGVGRGHFMSEQKREDDGSKILDTTENSRIY